jgi:hypothetical protein
MNNRNEYNIVTKHITYNDGLDEALRKMINVIEGATFQW